MNLSWCCTLCVWVDFLLPGLLDSFCRERSNYILSQNQEDYELYKATQYPTKCMFKLTSEVKDKFLGPI